MKPEDKYKDLVVFHEFPPMFLGASANQCCVVRIQRATPKSQIVVRQQEMYRTREVPEWKFGRQGISLPLATYIRLHDPAMCGPISAKIKELGLLAFDPEGEAELAAIQGDTGVSPELPASAPAHLYNVYLDAASTNVKEWLIYFVGVRVLSSLDDPRIEHGSPHVTLHKVALPTTLLHTLRPYWGRGMYWEYTK